MKKLIVAGLMALSVALAPATAAQPGRTIVHAAGWRFAGKYRSYKAAYRAACYLERQGYQTCMKKSPDGCWCVYCR